MSVAELGIVVPTTDIVKATDELGNLKREATDTERETGRAAQGIAQHYGKLKVAAMAAATAGIAAFRAQANRADDLAKTAQRIGIAVDELSRLQYMADLSGVSMGGLQTAVQQLSRKMVESEDDFEAYGIAVRDANGDLRSARDVMTDLADTFQGMEDGPEKTAAAMKLMGRSGTELIPMLNGGAEALRSMAAEADSLGIVITPEMAKNAEAFNDNITRLQRNITGLATSVTGAALPAVVGFSDAVVLGSQRLREGDWDGVLEGWSNAAGRLSASFAADMQEVSDNASQLAANVRDNLSGMVTGAVDAIGRTAAALAGGFASIASSAATWAGNIVRAFIDGLAALYQAGVDAIANLARGMREGITGLIEDAAGWGRDIAAGLAGGVSRGAGRVKDAVTGLASGVRGWFTDDLEIQSPSKVFERFGTWISEGLANGITAGEGQAKGAMQSLADGVAGVLTNAMSNGGSIGDGLRNMVSGLLGNTASGLFKTGISSLLGMIPGFATGTNYAPGGLARVNELGGEIINLPRGSQVIPHDLSKAAMQSQAANITYAPTWNIGQGVGREELAAVRAEMARDKQLFTQEVQRAIRNPRG